MKTVFVSSTFKDMQFERDAIRDKTTPLLNAEARKYGDEFDFCDLRWGINTGDMDIYEGSKKVLNVCLDEIDRCEPPMVVLLGYRYGWIPDASLIKAAAKRKDFELEDLERSVTALEIEYGSLCDEKKFRNTLFYFREIEGNSPSEYLAEDNEHKEKILALKARIERLAGGRIKHYTLKWNGDGFEGIHDFAEMLAEDLKAMFMPEWKKLESLTPFERERRSHDVFIREKNVMFKARYAEAQKLMEDAVSQPVTVIKGEVGSGKSTLLCHMATELEKTGWTVLPFISGLTMESNSADDIIKNTVYFIEEKLHIDHYIDEKDPQKDKKKKHTPDEWRNRLAEMCAAYAKNGNKLIIMLDAADQLIQSEERDKLHFIPTYVSDNIHFVMTCTTDFKTPGREYDTLRQLNDDDKQDVIGGILTRNGRELSGSVINEMLKLKCSDNPLYLSLLVQRLLMMNRDDYAAITSRGGDMAAIEKQQLELIRKQCPDDLDEMSAALLSEAGTRINKELVSKAAEYLAVSRNGLRKKDLSALLREEWVEVDFSHFVNYMNDCFLVRDDGRYDFTHKSIRAGFRSRCVDFDRANREILEHLKSLEDDDTVRMSEIIYHTIKVDDKKFFVEYLTKYRYHKNKSHIYRAALDVYQQCLADSGKWIIDVIKEEDKHEAEKEQSNLSIFCNFDLNRVFADSQKELEINLAVLSANMSFSERLYNRLKTDECNRDVAICYGNVAYMYEMLGGYSNLKKALSLYQEELKISTQLAKKQNTSFSERDLSRSYNDVARVYDELGSKFKSLEDLDKALELYHEALKIDKRLHKKLGTMDSKRKLSIDYKNIGGIHETIDLIGSLEDLEKARRWYNKALKIDKLLAEVQNTADAKRHLSISYRNVGKIYERKSVHQAAQECYNKARGYYGKALKIDEQLAEIQDDTDAKSNISTDYSNIARIYVKLGGEENLKQALKWNNKALKTDKQLAEIQGTSDAKSNLSIRYGNIAGIYEKLGGEENLKQALEWYAKALEVDEELAKEQDAFWRIDLADRYDDVAEQYKKLGGRENLERASELYCKALEIKDQLAQEPDSPLGMSLREFHGSYHDVAEMCEELGGRENLERALELYYKELEMGLLLVKHEKSILSQSDLSLGYYNVARIYEKLGGRENLERALERYCKALEVSEELEKSEDLAQESDIDIILLSKDDSFINSIARICEQLGGKENLERARELRQKLLT